MQDNDVFIEVHTLIYTLTNVKNEFKDYELM